VTVANRPRTHGVLVWVALWTVYIVWGSTYLAIGIAVETLPPFLMAGARFVVAGLIMGGIIAARRGMASLRVTGRQLLSCTVVGGALLLGGNAMVGVAEQDFPSGLAALIIASVPLWVVLLRTVTGDRVAGVTLMGVALGFGGVALLVLPGGRPTGASVAGVLLLLAASVSWASGSFVSTRLSMPSDPFVSTSIQMVVGGLLAVVVGLATGEAGAVDASTFSTSSALAFVYLITVGSLLGFTAYVWLLQNAPISKVATYAYVNPVIALLLGWIIRSESITTGMLLGAAIIVASVAFIVRRESVPGHADELVEERAAA
jgi:drug/metabolite transporter (DMT)-like permease